METNSINKRRRALLIALPLIVLLCVSLWYLRNFYRLEFVRMTRVQAVDGVYDLTGIDFSGGFVRLEGESKYIPAILTPEEFAAREEEAVVGGPWEVPAATSRAIIKVSEDGFYMVAGSSIDFAHRAYLNGELRFQAGVPAETAEEFVPGAGWMQVEVPATGGEIELVQQGGNFVHREGSGHGNLYFGRAGIVSRFTALTILTEAVKVGLFAALWLVHLLLFLVQRSYRPNLYFSLLCLAWAFRNSLTGAKVLVCLFPDLPWELGFRIEYLTLAAVLVVMVLLVREIFPGVVQRWFLTASGTVSSLFAGFCILADTLLLSRVQLGFNVLYIAAILCLCGRFAVKTPSMVRSGCFLTEHAVSLIGLVIFMYAAIHDMLYYSNAAPLILNFAMTDAAMLIFAFFQMTANFYGTMREAALAHEREHRAEEENEMLTEMNRLKSAFYTDMSHEMKTPLTVIAVNAQFAAQNIETGAVDEETVTDLNAISAEARRLAQMVTSLVGIGRMQGTGGLISLTPLLTETARIYQSLFARKENTLMVEADPDLPAVRGNADQLIQVLINLLSNANRHTSGGAVFIRAELLKSPGRADKPGGPERSGHVIFGQAERAPGAKILVSVADNREGIAPELLPHVFERFCHGEKGGSGLGLPICRTIIREHGGEIQIESEDGKGTTVWFTLPVKEGTESEGDRDDPPGGGR